MKASYTKIKKFWWLPLTTAILAVLLVLSVTTVVSADSPTDQLEWVTICHLQPGQTLEIQMICSYDLGEQCHGYVLPGQTSEAQTMVVYWSALDKCLSHFNDTIGACPNQ